MLTDEVFLGFDAEVHGTLCIKYLYMTAEYIWINTELYTDNMITLTFLSLQSLYISRNLLHKFTFKRK